MNKSKMIKENSVAKKFLFFGQNSNIHGLRYIAQVKGNIFTRLFWILVLATSTWCTYMLLLPVVLRGSAVNFTPDTLYLSWTTTFPAVTVCEKYIHTKAMRRFMEYYPDLLTPLDFTRRRYLSDLLYAKGTCSKCEPCGEKIPCDLRWRDIANKVRWNCEQLITNCSYNGQSFKCCERFLLVDSEDGPCYSVNTLQNTKSSELNQFIVNRTTGPGVLGFNALVDLKISIHSFEELSTSALDSSFVFEAYPSVESQTEFIFSIAEIENDPFLQRESIDVRGCRYLHEIPSEPFMNAYPVYSYGACTSSRDIQLRYAHCGCVHPVRDIAHEKMYCNFTGLNCLVQYEAQKTKFSDTTEDQVQVDDCLPACGESELTQVHLSRGGAPSTTGEGAHVTIKMSSIPNLRYQRNMLRNDLDMVVTVGGMVGLFFGASVLSLMEIMYLILRK